MSNDHTGPTPAPEFWRTLEERSMTNEFRSTVEREFAIQASLWDDPASRRQFLQSLGAIFGLAGLAGCVRQPAETIVPQVVTPNQRWGPLQKFATANPRSSGAIGVVVTSHEGRPIKIEGNSLHPASSGAADANSQASILDLYDPDRSQVIRQRGEISHLGTFLSELRSRLETHRERRGNGLCLVTGPLTSPTLLDQIRRLFELMPETRWFVHQNLAEDQVPLATVQSFGDESLVRYDFENVEVLFSLDSDLLGQDPDHLRLSRQFAQRRRASLPRVMRLYVAESTLTLTGAAADHRVPVSPNQMTALLVELARQLGVADDSIPPGLRDISPIDSFLERQWLQELATDLQAAGERALITVGAHLPAAAQQLGFELNARLGSLHSSLTLMPRIDRAGKNSAQPIISLITAMQEKDVKTLIILEENPAYGHPLAGLFDEALKQVEWTVHCGQYFDETAERCSWHVPTPHFLETWSDCRSREGVASIVQPLISPLYNSQSPHQILGHLLGDPALSAYEIVKQYWRKKKAQEGIGQNQFESFWGQALHDGIVPEPPPNPVRSVLRRETGKPATLVRHLPSTDSRSWSLVFRNDPYLVIGNQSNNSWLQELPRPFTSQTWGNAAWIGAAEADRNRWATGDIVTISSGGQSIRIPLFVVPGIASRTCILFLGYGRRRCGRHANGVGVDVSILQTPSNPWLTEGTVTFSGSSREHVELAITQPHQRMENRDLVRRTTHEQLKQGQLTHRQAVNEAGAPHQSESQSLSMYPQQTTEGPQWGMVINLGACVGCNACIVACQAENNIPSVGAEQVRNGRHMHWLRVDTYYTGLPDHPEVVHQPVMCMHCEHAPCEIVCPVAATTHSRDGLNEMTYNRCIGTRYCSNNCPYKVRRFNFLDYHSDLKSLPVLQLQPNPDVTVRSRGVMEKCTYCVQRIRRAGIAAKLENRSLSDGDVVTACQASCPTQAIVFGDLTDGQSQVSVAKADPLNYGLLEDLNTRPRTSYHAAIRNPNPKLSVGEAR